MEKYTSRGQKMSKKLEKLNSNYRSNPSKSSMLTIAVFLFLTVLTISPIFIGQGVAFKNSSAEVTIICSYEGTKIPNVELTIYPHENRIPIDQAESYQIDENGEILLILSHGEYAIEASISGETGFHGYRQFTIGSQQKHLNVIVNMKPNTNHNNPIDLTPTYANMIQEEDATLIHVFSAIPGEEEEETVPLILKDEIFQNKEKWTPVNLETLDPATKTILEKRQDEIQSMRSNVEINFGLLIYTIAIVDYETTYKVWHPIALVDSENGLTHSFDLSVYYGKEIKIESEVKCEGVSTSASYSTKETYSVDHGPLTVADGDTKTWKSEFRHKYQSGTVYLIIGFVVYEIGDFRREFIDHWYSLSYQSVPGASLSETRSNYLGEWRSSHSADVTMTSSATYSGSIGLSVQRSDIFGSVSISVKFSYNTKAHHHFVYNQPGSLWYVQFYSGRAFDINPYQYYAGGCPILSVFDGENYLDEGLLDIHNVEGEDVIHEHKITNSLKAIHGEYRLRLTEHQKTISSIDQVKLLAKLKNGDEIILYLVSAVHCKDGNVKRELKFSDDIKTVILGADHKNGPSEYIDLVFNSGSNLEIEEFIFIIEGNNILVK